MTKAAHLPSDSSLHTRFPHVPVSLCALSATCGCLGFSFFLSKEWVSTWEGEESTKVKKKKRIVFGPPLPSSYIFPGPPSSIIACVFAWISKSTVRASSQATLPPLPWMLWNERAKKKSKRMRPWRKQEEGISQLIPGLKKEFPRMPYS